MLRKGDGAGPTRGDGVQDVKGAGIALKHEVHFKFAGPGVH